MRTLFPTRWDGTSLVSGAEATNVHLSPMRACGVPSRRIIDALTGTVLHRFVVRLFTAGPDNIACKGRIATGYDAGLAVVDLFACFASPSATSTTSLRRIGNSVTS